MNSPREYVAVWQCGSAAVCGWVCLRLGSDINPHPRLATVDGILRGEREEKKERERERRRENGWSRTDSRSGDTRPFCSQPFYWMWLCGNAKLFAAFQAKLFSTARVLYILYIRAIYTMRYVYIYIYCKTGSEIVTQNGGRAKIIKRKANKNWEASEASRREQEKGREREKGREGEKPITHSINVGWMRMYSFVFVCDKQMPRTFFLSSFGRRAAFKSCVACCLAWCGMIRVSAAQTQTHTYAHTACICVWVTEPTSCEFQLRKQLKVLNRKFKEYSEVDWVFLWHNSNFWIPCEGECLEG